VRWENAFAVAAVFNASHIGQIEVAQSSFSPYWRESATQSAFVPIVTRWGGSFSVSETLPVELDRFVAKARSSADYMVSNDVAISLSPAISYELVPQKLDVWLSYTHEFALNSTAVLSSDPSQGMVTHLGGADGVAVTLSSTALPSAIENAID
jgi:hypothetical protein